VTHTYMALDQYGNTFHNLGPHPRKELLRRLYRQHAERMYVDKVQGDSVQVGYIIAGHWLTLYRIEPWEVPA